MTSIAINIAANTNEPGFRGPIWPDGSFEYIPIPEGKETGDRETVAEGRERKAPTYGELAPSLETTIPESLSDTPVHLDPEFPEYPFCERYTYGDEHGVKAGPLSSLKADDYLFFYATLSVAEQANWLPPDWGAFIIGHFQLLSDPVTPESYDELPSEKRRIFDNNAHVKRTTFDARILIAGDPANSRLYDRAFPLSAATGGTEPGEVVTDLSGDSGKGPWWRRPLRFDTKATEELLSRID